MREELVAEANGANGANGGVLPTSMHIVPMTPQIRGLHSFIRNKNTPRDEFTFYAKRLIRIVIEHALSLMPYQSITVISLSSSPGSPSTLNIDLILWHTHLIVCATV